MPFEKGNRANPGGRPNDRPWRDMLMLALSERAGKAKGDPKKLRRVAEAVVDAAMAGDMQAAKEIGDRLDGKPHQSTTISGDPDRPLITEVRETIVDPGNSGSEGAETASRSGPI